MSGPANKEAKGFSIPLNGQVIKSNDPATIGSNFQSLKNMEYTDTHPKAIQGMAKINSTALTTYTKIRNLFHYKKSQPAETHLLAQVLNSTDDSRVQQNTTAIPSTGDFSATALHSDAANSGTGRFSDAPDGACIYCNEKETMVYGGDEARIAAFINKSANDTFEYDFTEAVRNTLTDAENVATMYRHEDSIDTDTMLLLDFENDLTDNAGRHTPTNYNVTFDSFTPKLGSYCASFNGSSSYITVDSSADFNFGDSTLTIEMWFKESLGSSEQTLFYRGSVDTDYIRIYLSRTGSTPQAYKYYVNFKVVEGNNTKVNISTQFKPGTWKHVACCRSANNWYLYLDGNLGSSVVVAATTTTTGNVNIGRTAGGTPGSYFNGLMDELRVSDVCRYTSEFTPRTVPFGSHDNVVLYIGTLRPIEAIKLYIGTANTTTATIDYVEYWGASGWARCSNVVDGTASSGKTLAATGSVTFSSTVSLAKTTILFNRYLYWYRILVADADETTTIYHATVKAPFQSLKDIWDGALRRIYSYKRYASSIYYDYTVNVSADTYTATDSSTYGSGTIETSTGYIYMGFDERMSGIYINYAETYVNIVASTDLTIEYWDGEEWKAVSGLSDGTSSGGISSGRTGYISWNSPESYQEFRKSISRGPMLFYYRLSYSKTLTDNIRVAYVGGIPAQKTIPGYKFSFMDANRLYLCSETSNNQNEILALKAETNCVANGEDSIKISFGDENPITAGGNLYAQLGSNIYDIKVICKSSEVWMLTGKSPKDFEKRKIYSNDGCVSPLTFDTAVVNIGGTYRPVAIWQGANGLYLYDGSTVVPISRDISQFFDPYAETKIYSSMIHKSVGKINPAKSRYHWLFASGSSTTLDKEWVYDIVRNKWFEIDRTYKLQAIAKAVDTYGNIYMYGAEDRGYLQRLDYGTTWDGEDMDFTLHTSDFMLAPDTETLITELQVKMLAKDADNMVKITHYGDTYEMGTEMLLTPSNEAHRLTDEVLGTNLGNHVYHSLKIETSTNGESVAFEPIGINGKFIPIRDHRR